MKLMNFITPITIKKNVFRFRLLFSVPSIHYSNRTLWIWWRWFVFILAISMSIICIRCCEFVSEASWEKILKEWNKIRMKKWKYVFHSINPFIVVYPRKNKNFKFLLVDEISKTLTSRGFFTDCSQILSYVFHKLLRMHMYRVGHFRWVWTRNTF